MEKTKFTSESAATTRRDLAKPEDINAVSPFSTKNKIKNKNNYNNILSPYLKAPPQITFSPNGQTMNATLRLHVSPPPPPSPPQSSSATAKPNSLRLYSTVNSSNTASLSTCTSTNILSDQQQQRDKDHTLLALLQQRKTEDAWNFYSQQCTQLPSPTCLSRLLAQLSHQNTAHSLARAQSIIHRLRRIGQLHRLDANSLGHLSVAAVKRGHTLYAASIIKSMLKSGYLPHVKAWSAVVSKLASSSDDGPVEAIRLFDLVVKRVRSFDYADVVKDSKPDTGAYNAVLNACANTGDCDRFAQLFGEMSELGCRPDVLTYNVMIKMCARVGRRDLLAFVLDRMVEKNVELCVTTLHSLVAAYVGFDDLKTAEEIVQAMREGRRDISRILREAEEERSLEYDDDGMVVNSNCIIDGLFEKLLPNSVEFDKEPSVLPKIFAPDVRIYTTLMKGYMKAGRVSDTVRMLEAMRSQKDSSSHPDHVTYTTVISAFVKAKEMDKARQVLFEMARLGVPANLITYNILLNGYCQQLQIDKAEDLLREMIEEVEIEPDVVSYNTLIDGCILVDDSTGALAYFNEMRKRGIAPTKVSYTTLMKAFALSNQPKLAHKVFDEMLKDPRVKVDLIAWNMLVEGYCKLGLVNEAKSVIQTMKENGIYPNVATYGSLANGIALARKPGEALLLWNEVKERCGIKFEGEGTVSSSSSSSSSSNVPPLKPDEGLLDSLADICVRAAFFKRALEIVACMEEHGISPNKTKYKRIYVEMHSRMFTSKHASRARQDRRRERKRAAEAFKFWLGLPNSYYGSEWRLDSSYGADE